MDKNKKSTTLDNETKIKLLITLINDEGKQKLSTSLEKLITRLNETIETEPYIVSKYLKKAILMLPLKAPIYAYVLARLSQNHFNFVKNFIEDIVNSLQSLFKGYFFFNLDVESVSRIIAFLFELFSVGLINLKLVKQIIDFLIDINDVSVESISLYVLLTNIFRLNEDIVKADKIYFDGVFNKINQKIEKIEPNKGKVDIFS